MLAAMASQEKEARQAVARREKAGGRENYHLASGVQPVGRLAVLLLLGMLCAGCARPVPQDGAARPLHLVCEVPCGSPIDAGGRHPREFAMAVDPTDPRRIVLASMDMVTTGPLALSELWVYQTSDGGGSWSAARLPPPRAGDNGSDPSVQVFPDGEMLVVGLYGEGALVVTPVGSGATWNRDLVAYRSQDHDRTWQGPIEINPARVDAPVPAASSDSDGPRVAVAPDGEALVAWLGGDGSGRTISASVSRDFGTTWSSPRVLASGDEVGSGNPSPTILPDGAYVVPYNWRSAPASGGTNPPSPCLDPEARFPATNINVSVSLDGGRAWSDSVLAANTSSIWPSAVPTDGGTVAFTVPNANRTGDDLVAVHDVEHGGARPVVLEPDILVPRFSAVVPSPTLASAGSVVASIAVARDGRAHVTAFDATRRSPPVALGGPAIHFPAPNACGYPDYAPYGEYVGIAGGDGFVTAAWLAGSDSSPQLFFARLDVR